MQTIRIIDDEHLEVTIDTPIKHDGRETHTIALRSPRAIDAEGLSQDLIKIKHTDQVQKLLSKISTPTLTRMQYMQLPMTDAAVLNTALDFFSATGKARTEITEALQELGLTLADASATEPNSSPA